MDVYKNLPAPARIAIPIALALVLFLMLYMTVLKSPAPEVILETQDQDVYTTAKELLGGSINYTEEAQGGTFTLMVPPGDAATDARLKLAGAGVKDLAGEVKDVKCAAAPGFTATRAANVRADNCNDEEKVQQVIVGLGATAARVTVSQAENDSFSGPAMTKNVAAVVYLPKNLQASWPSEDVAHQIATMVNTPIERVYLSGADGHAIFDGGRAKSREAAKTGSSSSLGCGDIADATEIITKQTAVSNCRASELGERVLELVGGAEYFVLNVEVTVDSTASTTTSSEHSPGPSSHKSEQAGGGATTKEETTPPNNEETTVMNPAGDVTREAITVSLDRDHVNAEQELAVKRILTSARNVGRGDPEPVVTRIAFPGATGAAPRNDNIDAMKKALAEDKKTNTAQLDPQTKTPKAMIAFMVLLIGLLVTAIVMLWRRSQGMSEERKRMEEAFQNDQRLFENFANQNPDDIAKDLETLFGQPSAHRSN